MEEKQKTHGEALTLRTGRIRMTDPYVVLGVSRTASDEEIKKKYRELARKYHPDNYVNNPLADLAQEKMKEINEAYDAITQERANGGTQYKTYSQPGSTSSGSATGPYRDVRAAIMAGDLARAEMILGSIVDRNAEWNFLMGIVKTRRGFYYDAMRFFETACYLEPQNAEYKQALNDIREQSNSYGQGYRTYQGGGADDRGCSACDICQTLMCANCCCECMGGDSCSCC